LSIKVQVEVQPTGQLAHLFQLFETEIKLV